MTKLRTEKKAHTLRGVAALITAAFLILLFTGCPNANGSKPTPSSKYMVTFSVDEGGGTLTAKIGETEIKSGNEVEANKTVTFTATPNKDFKVKGWALDGKAVNGTDNFYQLRIEKAVTVTVRFEKLPPGTFAVNFGVDGSNGNLTAAVDGKTITSGTEVEKGKKVTFTATPNTGYKIKGWMLDGNAVNGTVNSYQLKIEKAVTVKVSFEAIPPTKYTVTLNQTEHGKVTASLEIPTDGKVDENTVITFTAEAEAGYRVGTWSVSPSSAIKSGGGKGDATATVKITADTTVSVSFELVPETVILTLSPEKLTIKVEAKTADDSDIQVEGCTETTLKSDELTELHATGTRVVLKGKITELNCNGNQLTALNVQGLTALEELLCRNNQLTTLDVSGLTTLKELGCNGNQLTSLNVSGCTTLQKLGCFRNQLTSLSVQGLISLQMLGCHGNQLASLDTSGLTALKRLSCYNNKLNAQAMTELLNALPTRGASDDAKATLYTEKTEPVEDNCKDYNRPAELKTAFEGARGRHWKLQKEKLDGTEDDI